MKELMISIIIPTYNRADLIAETLDSILAQSYREWECIIVDDGSTDTTETIVRQYVKEDSRFRYHHRPKNRRKGANTCRNFGFELSKGRYVQWFDSDDIMLPDFLSTKVKGFNQENCDYVITLTEDFNHPDPSDVIGVNTKYYRFDTFELSHYNYCVQNINWLTPDVCVKRELAQRLSFNEKLPSGQEYNFNCKLTAISENALLIQKVVAKRRLHTSSIKGDLRKDKKKYLRNRGIITFENWSDLKAIHSGNSHKTIPYFFKETVGISLNTEVSYATSRLCTLVLELVRKSNFSAVVFYLLYQVTGRLLGKGHFLRKKFLKNWKR